MLRLLQPNFRWIFFAWECFLPENLRSIGRVLFELFNFVYSCWMKTSQTPSRTSWIIAWNSRRTEGVNRTTTVVWQIVHVASRLTFFIWFCVTAIGSRTKPVASCRSGWRAHANWWPNIISKNNIRKNVDKTKGFAAVVGAVRGPRRQESGLRKTLLYGKVIGRLSSPFR